jgi:Glycine cleavage system T protein (aminomethyltransferase)
VQGPKAQALMEAVHGGPLPEMPFFRMGQFMLAGVPVTALNHRMSGAPGYEFWGDADKAEIVRAALFETGAAHGLTQIGGRNYPVTAQESGWWASPVPAIYTDPALEEYRQWLPAASYEGTLSVGGSLVTDDIEVAYMTPRDLGYGFMVKFDHDFVGRAALEAQQGQPGRRKVRLYWDDADVLRIFGAMTGEGPRLKGLEMPTAQFSTCPMDEVTLEGRRVGVSNYPAYSANLRRWFSLGSVEAGLAVDGTRLQVTWGEPGGGSKKPTVEPHEQTQINVTVQARAVNRD